MKNKKSFFASLFCAWRTVNLPSMNIFISRDGLNSLLTKGNLRAAVDVQVNIKFKRRKAITEIVEKFGHLYLTDPEQLQMKIEDMLIDKLKLVVYRTTSQEFKNNKKKVVLDLIKELEKEKWMTIVYVDISKLSQTKWATIPQLC